MNDKLDDLKDYLENICDQLDGLDEKPFSVFGIALNDVAENANKARRLCDLIITEEKRNQKLR